MSCGRLWQMPDGWTGRCNAAHREIHAIFVQPLRFWHWFSLMGTFLPFEIITYAI
jgi:hypothetical protein